MANDNKKNLKDEKPSSKVDISGEVPDDDMASGVSQSENSQQVLIAMDDDGSIQNNILNSIPGVKVADDDDGGDGGGGDDDGGGGGGKGGGGGGSGDDN